MSAGWPGLVWRYGGWALNTRFSCIDVMDEIEVGPQAAKVWAWTDHYVPPEQYARIRREQAARDARRAEPAPVCEPAVLAGQLELFAEAS